MLAVLLPCCGHTEGCSWHNFLSKGMETVAISLLLCVGQGTFAGCCDLERDEIAGEAGFAIFVHQLPTGSGAGGVLSVFAEHSQPPSLGSNGKCGFMLLLPRLLRALCTC